MMLRTHVVILTVVLGYSALVACNSVKRELDLCETKSCRAGRECVIRKGAAQCQCVKSCPAHAHRVCGSDDITYHNYCELHRTACVEHRAIRVNYKGPCKALHLHPRKMLKTNSEREHSWRDHLPLVCSTTQRNKLRKMVMDWLLQTISENTYETVVRKKFKECDYNQDSQLTSDELLACLENHGIAKFNQIKDGVKEHLVRGLCADAVIGMGDTNSDWQLNREEFVTIMEPEFIPKEKGCELEGKQYKDGATSKGHCKVCVCSTGRWVCSGSNCVKKSDAVEIKATPYQKEVQKMIEEFKRKDKRKNAKP